MVYDTGSREWEEAFAPTIHVATRVLDHAGEGWPRDIRTTVRDTTFNHCFCLGIDSDLTGTVLLYFSRSVFFLSGGAREHRDNVSVLPICFEQRNSGLEKSYDHAIAHDALRVDRERRRSFVRLHSNSCRHGYYDMITAMMNVDIFDYRIFIVTFIDLLCHVCGGA